MRVKLSNSRKNKIIIEAKEQCQECGSTTSIQLHHISYDPESLICLCGECHSRKHSNVPKEAFFSKPTRGYYWTNTSATYLARQMNCHCRTITRSAKKLDIPPGEELSAVDKERIIQDIKSNTRGPKEIGPKYFWRRPRNLNSNYWNFGIRLTS